MSSDRAGRRGLSVIPGLAAFLVLCTLNAAGYRYGASDQAFYIPAILERLDPTLYPRDSALIVSQSKLTLVDEILAPVIRATGVSLPVLCAVLYVTSLGLLALGALRIGSAVYRTPWAGMALLAAITLRHAIAKSGTNTLEGYFHPRQLAFGAGAVAVAAFLRHGGLAAAPLLAVAALAHPTTGLWFIVWLGVATFAAEPRWRAALGIGGAVAIAAAIWALTAGPLAGRLQVMDEAWLATLATKDYLFPLAWPAYAWVLNLGYVPIVVWAYRRRAAAGLAVPREGALVIGCLSLAAVFGVALALHTVRVALAIQLQPARIFWMLDFLATMYVVWAIAEGAAPSVRRAAVTAAAILAFSIVRGGYVAFVRFPDRPPARLGLADDEWGRAMAWARASSKTSGWIADPGHAARYGTSVRVAGQRDVFVEEIKDTAIGMYDRGVAMRTRDRLQALGDFTLLTAPRARDLAARYDLDYLVIDRNLPLPVVFQSEELRIYSLR